MQKFNYTENRENSGLGGAVTFDRKTFLATLQFSFAAASCGWI
jgi:hypothetical protein